MAKRRNIVLSFTLITVSVLVSVFFSGCADPSSDKPMGKAGTKTFFIYMCGSTLETKKAAGSQNITDILNCTIPDSTSVIIQTGGAEKWRDHDINPNLSQRYLIKDGKLTLLSEAEKKNMGTPDTLSEFLIWGVENYPAEKMSVILWNHGGGSLSGVCFDEQYGMDGLFLQEIDTAFSEVSEKMTDRFEFVGFDACLMANIETAQIMSKYARNMIASEEIEPSGGWDYASVISDIDAVDYYEKILEGYRRKCEEGSISSYTLSHIDLTAFGNISNSFDDFSASLEEAAKTSLKPVVDAAADAIAFGYNSQAEGYSNLIDLADFSKILGEENLSEVIEKNISCVNGKTEDGACGLSVYYPVKDVSDVSGYIANCKNETYRSFLSEHYTALQDEPLISFIDRGSNKDGELHISLTEESMKYLYDVEYHLYQFVSEEEYKQRVFGLGSDSDLISDGENGFTTDFEGKWITLNGEFINVSVIARRGTLTTFSTPVKRNGETGTIRFTFDSENREISILGFLPAGENGASDRLQTLSTGDTLTILYDERTYDYSLNLVDWKEVAIDGDADIRVEKLPDGYYQSFIVVTDIFGNRYYSNDAVLLKEGDRLSVNAISEDVDHTDEEE